MYKVFELNANMGQGEAGEDDHYHHHTPLLLSSAQQPLVEEDPDPPPPPPFKRTGMSVFFFLSSFNHPMLEIFKQRTCNIGFSIYYTCTYSFVYLSRSVYWQIQLTCDGICDLWVRICNIVFSIYYMCTCSLGHLQISIRKPINQPIMVYVTIEHKFLGFNCRECMDSSGTYNNRSDRFRGAVTGMEHGSIGLDCWSIGHALLCLPHPCFLFPPL